MNDYALTDVGRVRAHNQDYLYSSSSPVGDLENLYLVADGMGGHRAGDYASRFLVEHLVAYFEQNHGGDPDISLGFGNLEYVCLECHNKEHGNAAEIEGMVKYVFGPEGEVIPVAEGKRQTPPLIEERFLTIRDRPPTSKICTGHHKRGVV